jgi:hypothetical protein
MTPAEEIALNEAKVALAAHFDAFVITTRASDGAGDRVNSDWHGALSDVFGLNSMTQLRMERLILDRSGEPDVK